MPRKWTAADDDFIKAHAGKYGVEWMAQQLGRTRVTVQAYAQRLKVSTRLKMLEVCPDCGKPFTRQRNFAVAVGKNPEGRCGICLVKKRTEDSYERRSVRGHHRRIFDSAHEAHGNYKDMPFFGGWNPDKGGSFQAGAQWIIDNLGRHPDGSTLHVIDHAKGFVPGNLEWTHPKKQTNQQMYKIIAQQRHSIKNLKRQLIEAQQVIALAA
jgi:hypothetical protein